MGTAISTYSTTLQFTCTYLHLPHWKVNHLRVGTGLISFCIPRVLTFSLALLNESEILKAFINWKNYEQKLGFTSLDDTEALTDSDPYGPSNLPLSIPTKRSTGLLYSVWSTHHSKTTIDIASLHLTTIISGNHNHVSGPLSTLTQ